MLTLTAEQVRTLAPDASAARSGEALADRRRWTAAGRSDAAAWGLCQGSGSTPYQVAVDMAGPAYKCSCPSRKIPCKHALGLMFFVADGGVTTAEPPDWVQTWLTSRAGRAAAAATRAERPTEIDPEARAKRVASRERKVAAGIDELDRWLRDLMRRGLDSARGEGYRFWDSMGARLVDAQAGGLGRSVRGLGSAANSGDAWPHLLLEGVGRLHLLSEAYRRSDHLPEDLRADVRALVGWNVKEDELDAANAVDDRWLVIGQRIDDRGDIVTARTYLVGESTGRIGLQLAFGVGAAPPTLLAVPGQAFRATVTFYPSATPLRIAVRPPIVPDGDVTAVPNGITLPDVVEEHAARLARNPFAGAWPVVIRDVVPVVHGDRLLVRDAAGVALPVVGPEVAPRLLAVSGGDPLVLVAEWDGAWLRPLAAFADGHLATVIAATDLVEVKIDDADWSTLVSAALLGTERTGGTVPVPAAVAGLTSGAETEQQLLAAAGAMAVRRRAGRTTALDETPSPAPAERDPRPQLTGAPARYVGLALEERPSLAPEVLELVRRSGRRVPDGWLPELMALAARTDDGDGSLQDLAGPRAAWLARNVPALAGDASWEIGDGWDAAWAAARGGAARARLLRRFRQLDLPRARRSLAGWWSDIASDERARVLAAIRPDLGADDEPLLTDALTDRRADVRRTAVGLIVRLPGSAVAARLETVARPLLATSGLVRKSIKVALPAPSDEFEALGVGRPASGYGERAWLLRSLLALVRPDRWSEWLGVDASGLVDQAARSDEARPLLEGWIEATARFGDPEWALAILGNKSVPTKVTSDLGSLLSELSRAARADAIAKTADALDPSVLDGLAATVPATWPRSLGDAVLEAAGAAGREQYPAPGFYELVRTAALRLPPDRASELETVASYKDEIRPSLIDVIETIRIRARIHEAFAALPPLPA